MKVKFKFKDVHSCDAVVLTCIDFRFWRATAGFVEKELGIENFDFPSLPGSAKAINECLLDSDVALQCIGVPVSLHHAKRVVIVNHEDCGAYGGSKAFGSPEDEQNFHEKELKKAKSKLEEKYPDKKYILVYARLTEEKENIEFVLF